MASGRISSSSQQQQDRRLRLTIGLHVGLLRLKFPDLCRLAHDPSRSANRNGVLYGLDPNRQVYPLEHHLALVRLT